MYAERKKWDLKEVFVYISHSKKRRDSSDQENSSYLDFITKKLRFIGDLDEKQKQRLKEIASKCPVHKTLASGVSFETEVLD